MEDEPKVITVGALGNLTFSPGYYCYVGSAMAGLRARIKRHFRRTEKRLHWHVDYLRERSPAIAAVKWTTPHRAECVLSQKVAELSESSIPGFGASDCSCASHLYFFRHNPVQNLRRILLQGVSPDVALPGSEQSR